MKRLFFIAMICISCAPVFARHVAGGELFYTYLGQGSLPGYSSYRITLRLFRDCQSTGPLLQAENPILGVYEGNSLIRSQNLLIDGGIRTIQLNTGAFPCLVGSVIVCYEVATYTTTIELQDNNDGYTLSRIGCCRVDFIDNLSQPRNVGSNYVTKIPGKNSLPAGHNSSPQFNVRDTALVCANKTFKLDFGATDADADSLTFDLCDAYTSNGSSNNSPPTPSLNLLALPYASPFSGSSPLGSRVNINHATGIISGIAPGQGQYVVNVCITEWRGGKAFTEHRKDFILKVQNCDFVEAVLPDKIVQCDDFKVHFENLSQSSAITSYTWTLFNASAGTDFVSNDPVVDFTYADTGRYRVKLNVTGPAGCLGEASTEVLVYPGFKAGFKVAGSCVQKPYVFTDTTYARYGAVDSWRWDFGDAAVTTDTSTQQNPTYKYSVASDKKINLIVTSNKGCIDTATLDLIVLDKPKLLLPFRDTLICDIDTLPIPIGNSGTVSWSPNKNIIGISSSNPLVFPKDTTRYIVTVNDNGCINTDSVTVNVLPFITVSAGNDLVICTSDAVRFQTVSHALAYQWTSSTGEKVSPEKFPQVRPLVNTTYYVVANLGHCQDKDTVNVKVVDYPKVDAGADTIICFGSRVQLHGRTNGSSFSWSPVASLIGANTLNPVAGPGKTTAYVLRATDTLGCPKPSLDTVVISVTPTVIADAGRDTTVAPDQPLQLSASGGKQYRWSPALGLSDPDIPDPIAILGVDIDSITYHLRVFSDGGCYGDDEVTVKVSRNGPEIFVPSAFTPDGDGKNDILKPIAVGISNFTFFRVYNRWGQLLFSTPIQGRGWDGTYKGLKQPPGTYVYQAEGFDFRNTRVFRKGTVVLIR